MVEMLRLGLYFHIQNLERGYMKKMDENTKEKLDTYVEVFSELKEKTGSERIALALLEEVAKERRTGQMHGQKEPTNGDPATERQKKFMKNLGINFPKDVTKKEASALIDEELGRNGE
jgi:hypothetical protein